jgi:hypothetical protein
MYENIKNVDPENVKRAEKFGIQDVNVWITRRGIL